MIEEVQSEDRFPNGSVQADLAYRIIQCRGCETFSFQRLVTEEGDYDEEGGPLTRVTIYPSPTAGHEPILCSMDFPPKVRRMYVETVQALNVSAPVLATVGMRALVEAICLDQGCTTGNLEDKIQGLVDQGVLAKAQADFLHVHRFLGNDAAHEMTPPPASEIISALDILENLLRTIYELPTKAAALTASRARRRQTPRPRPRPRPTS